MLECICTVVNKCPDLQKRGVPCEEKGFSNLRLYKAKRWQLNTLVSYTFQMKILNIACVLFLATTSVLAQANKNYVTTPCVFNKLRHCEKGWQKIIVERQCYCQRPLNEQEMAARRNELCKTYTRECLTYGKNFDRSQPNGVYCFNIGYFCSAATWDAFCNEAKAKGYRFQCEMQVVSPPYRTPDDYRDIEFEYHEYPGQQSSTDEWIEDYLQLSDNIHYIN